MVFNPPSWVPQLPIDPPDSIPILEFMRNEKYGRYPLSKSNAPFTCGLTGKSYSAVELFQRSEHLARSFSKKLGWQPNEGTPWDKVACIFSLNSIDYITAAYGVHRLSGIVTTANAVYSVDELEHQLRSSSSGVLITCTPLLDVALKAAKAAGLAEDKVYLLDIAGVEPTTSSKFAKIDDLISEGVSLPELQALSWAAGQGARQPAFLCYSSGTSGLPKAVMISHYNVIANILQYTTFESVSRSRNGIKTQNVPGLLPFSHIYALVAMCHACTWRGDGVIVLPKFELKIFLRAIQDYKINQLFVVPPLIIQLLREKALCKQFDLSSIRFVSSGAAPLGEELIAELEKIYPAWKIGQAYGMTETSVMVTAPSEYDILKKSSGNLVAGCRAKIIDPEGIEITEYDKAGELLIQSPAVVLGYLNNEKATAETFVHHNDGRWIRTGDEALMTLAPSGNEHLVIVDRIKELIKVKGHQVAPAELEAHLLAHPAVADCAVIQVPDPSSGEVPKAFVVKSEESPSVSDEELATILTKHVSDHKAHYKWLKGGIEFLEIIPKSPSGKILRRLLRDKEKQRRKAEGPRL